MNGDELIAMYADIHSSREYGASSIKNLRYFRPAIKLLHPMSVIDYGCGQSKLLDHLDLPYPVQTRRYDPAIPEYSEKPDGIFDLLINIDVLEHVLEPDIDPIVEEMRSMCRHAILVVDTVPARLILPNGQNAHVTIKPKEWWAQKLGRHFNYLVPIRASRPWRAAFRTWDRPLRQEVAFRAMRVREELRYVASRISYLASR
jgi:hypothetical protein